MFPLCDALLKRVDLWRLIMLNEAEKTLGNSVDDGLTVAQPEVGFHGLAAQAGFGF